MQMKKPTKVGFFALNPNSVLFTDQAPSPAFTYLVLEIQGVLYVLNPRTLDPGTTLYFNIALQGHYGTQYSTCRRKGRQIP